MGKIGLARLLGHLRPNRAHRIKTVVVFLILLSCIGGGAQTTRATFLSQTRNPGNSFASGTVILGDDDAGSNLVTASGLAMNQTVSSCIDVTYTGSVPSTVRLYGTSSGTLVTYLTMKVTRGTNSSAFPSCAGFTADATTYIGGQSAGVVYNGALASYPSTYAAGVIDPPTGAATWTSGTTRAYKVELTVANNTAASNSSASATLTWEARNT